MDLSKVVGAYEGFRRNEFFACLCFSGDLRSADSKRIRETTSGKPIGWLIPSLYFSEPDLFYDVRYLADFAYAGFLSFWNDSQFADARDSLAPRGVVDQLQFSDLIPENISFLVFSRQEVKRSKANIHDIGFSLMRQGFWPFHSQLKFELFRENHAQVLSTYQPGEDRNYSGASLSVRKVSGECAPVRGLFESLFSMGHSDMPGLGGFLYSYQVFEYLMEECFSNLVFSLSSLNFPAWKLKRKLSDVTSEGYRLRKIAERAQKNGAATWIFDALGTACKDFLTETVPETSIDPSTWIDYVYACRNVIMHNHLSILRAGTSKSLLRINVLLRRAAIEMLFCY